MICVDRRNFLKLSAFAAGAMASPRFSRADTPGGAFANLKPMTGGVKPITDQERLERMEKARKRMIENKIDAIYLEAGTSLFYFTGVQWHGSERMFAAVLPARGEIAWVCPAFEEQRARELIRFGSDIRTWQEDESPYKKIAGIFQDRGILTGTIGMEERVRFFLFDGIRKEAPQLTFVSADPVTAGCRMIKSAAELALMQRANDITIAAYKASVDTLKEGITTDEFSANISAAFGALGVEGEAFTSFGKYTAFPHGSIQPQKLKEGDVVLMDGGCDVEKYGSDVTRTFVFGKPSARQRDIWNLERKAQDAAFAAAKVGATCESIDAAARKVITDAGFGPDYKVPGLPHRTGHGIGLDGHEWAYLVRGNQTRLAPGMCFSDEPTIVIYGEFGIRLEDCMYITEDGPRMFTVQSPSIDHPFGS